jgi:sulfur relay (sulfurtransferase) DsrC/TusE family protein
MSDKVYINEECVLPLYDQLETIKQDSEAKELDIFLYSRGGTTETPWKIVSLLREFFPRYNVIIPYRAHSAATHIALGAQELIMGPLAELSPVDPTRMHPLLPKGSDGTPIPISVQDLKHCISFIRNEAKDRYTAEAVAEIYTSLFEYINPLALGAIEQSYRLARLISTNILETRFDEVKDGKKIAHIVDILSADYQSHAYPISRVEAKDDLGLNTIAPDDQLKQAIWKLYLYYREQANTSYQEDQSATQTRHLAFIDTIQRRIVLRQQYQSVQTEEGATAENILTTQWIKL